MPENEPYDNPLTRAELDEAMEVFLTEHTAGTINAEGESGIRRDLRAAIDCVLIDRAIANRHDPMREALRQIADVARTLVHAQAIAVDALRADDDA
jgi:hypothetical protein